MPCLELKVPSQPSAAPASRLRTLVEKPGAAVLRRNQIAEAPGHEDPMLRSRLRVTAVLAVDLTDPPREDSAKETPAKEGEAAEPPPEEERPAVEETAQEEPDSLAGSFAKGLEIWVADGTRAACVYADVEEIAGALAMFGAYLRLARYPPAFQRLDQRIVGLTYLFQEGLSVGIQGEPGEAAHAMDPSLEAMSAIADLEDFRDTRLGVRFSNAGVSYFHDLLRSAWAWLDENSYPSILGSK